MFTGKQQRDGVGALPFIVAGLFRMSDGPCFAPSAPDGDTRDAAGDLVQDVEDRSEWLEDDDGYAGDAEDASADVGKRFQYNRAAYRAVWKDFPIDQAITALSPEYASLYSRISGQVRSCVPPPMTLSLGQSIAEQASRFVVRFVNPIFGPIHSTKVHKLLCHVLKAIRWHGHLQNGDTAHNESLHKHDKPFYCRTNKHLKSFTRQLVVRARGTHAVLARLGARTSQHQPVPPFLQQMQTPESLAATPSEDGEDAGRRPATRSSSHLRRVTIDLLSQLPDLKEIDGMLGLPAEFIVSNMEHVKFNDVMECGTRTVQTMHAAASYYNNAWFDTVLYQDEPGENSASVGVLRAVPCLPGGDVAIVCEMESVQAVECSPLVRRGCDRLAW